MQAILIIAAELLAAASRDPTLEAVALALAPTGTWLALAHDLPEHYAALLDPVQDDIELRLAIRDAINKASARRDHPAAPPPPT